MMVILSPSPSYNELVHQVDEARSKDSMLEGDQRSICGETSYECSLFVSISLSFRLKVFFSSLLQIFYLGLSLQYFG